MNHRKERFIETFVTVMFPVALLVACTSKSPDSETAANTALQASPVELTRQLSSQNASQPISKDLNLTIDGEIKNYKTALHALAGKSMNKKNSGTNSDDHSAKLKVPEKSIFWFGSDKHDIGIEDMESLKQHADFLVQHPKMILTVSGHSDRIGSDAYNRKLSKQRAQLVASILQKYGVSRSQLIIDAYGDTQPLVSPDHLKENRRVELQYAPAGSVNSL